MSSPMRIAFLGDVVGQPGKRAAIAAAKSLRASWGDAGGIIVANGENIRNGSGITPELLGHLVQGGIDAVTLGDHALRELKIVPALERAGEPICRPANMPYRAPGKRSVRIDRGAGRRGVTVFTVLGRTFMPTPGSDPFECCERMLAERTHADDIVIVEAHMEATSEKIALARFLDGRVAAVVGTHTHVPTADARILKGGTAFMTDLGMCGPYDSIIGRSTEAVLRHLTTGLPTQYDVAEGGTLACGAVIQISEDTGLARSIERYELSA